VCLKHVAKKGLWKPREAAFSIQHTYRCNLQIDKTKYKFGIILRKTSHLGLNLFAPKTAANMTNHIRSNSIDEAL
jgi:hypothetical protein